MRIAKVVVVDVEMPFASMVIFMVKWALASIPALFIVVAPILAYLYWVGSP